jgi:hypothetical protein
LFALDISIVTSSKQDTAPSVNVHFCGTVPMGQLQRKCHRDFIGLSIHNLSRVSMPHPDASVPHSAAVLGGRSSIFIIAEYSFVFCVVAAAVAIVPHGLPERAAR